MNWTAVGVLLSALVAVVSGLVWLHRQTVGRLGRELAALQADHQRLKVYAHLRAHELANATQVHLARLEDILGPEDPPARP